MTKAQPGGRVLIVEDDAGTAAKLGDVLRRRGYDVEWVTGGREGLRRLGEGLVVDVVVIDLVLPRPDGAEIAAQLVEHEGRPAVIVFWSRHQKSAETHVLEAGSLREPLDVVRLLEAMAPAISSSASDGAAALETAIDALLSAPPVLGESIEDDSWQPARRVVNLALGFPGEAKLRTTSYALDLALRSYRSAESAERALLDTLVPVGGGEIDVAVGDAYCFSLLQLAFTIARDTGNRRRRERHHEHRATTSREDR